MTGGRPDRVKVGFIDFAVHYLSDEEWLKAGHADDDGGEMDGSKGVIFVRLNPDMHPIHEREVLLHEINHACVYASGLSFENPRMHEDIEEMFVRRISSLLIDVLRSNPDVTKFLTS